jgi:preprotein translocase subunit SecA
MNFSVEPLPTPGLVWGDYPERPERRDKLFTRMTAGLSAWACAPRRLASKPYRGFVARTQELHAQFEKERIQPEHHLRDLRARLAAQGLTDLTLAECFAVICIVAERSVGWRPHDNQIFAARVLLDRRLAEMATGEGKTLAIAIAAASAALAGIPVHVMTANDDLACRDAERLAPLYAAIGLSVGVVTHASSAPERRQAYGRDIVYCTAKEVGFDYLRDTLACAGRRGDMHRRLAMLDGREAPTRLLRGLCMAILDEADSILLDEARVPLILARSHDRSRELEDLEQGLALATQLSVGADFLLDRESRVARLTEAGRERLMHATQHLSSLWRHRQHRENRVTLALAALHLFVRDRDYLVRDDRVEIIDPITGRIAEGRAWSQGLHQFIEMKEACARTQGQHPVAQITFQRLFRRYHWLSGISGTLAEARVELNQVYGLRVIRVPLDKPDQRRNLGARLCPDWQAQCRAIVSRTLAIHATGRPVLIGTDSVAESEALAEALRAAGIRPQVLNARQDREEARIIAPAGLRGQVMVTTNMAGRGTDIALGSGVEAMGGLHVISCQANVDRRIDRQLAGRSARQGEAGSVESILNLDSQLCQRRLPDWLRRGLAAGLVGPTSAWAQVVGLGLIRLARRAEEHQASAARNRMLRDDQRLAAQLAFTGLPE